MVRRASVDIVDVIVVAIAVNDVDDNDDVITFNSNAKICFIIAFGLSVKYFDFNISFWTMYVFIANFFLPFDCNLHDDDHKLKCAFFRLSYSKKINVEKSSSRSWPKRRNIAFTLCHRSKAIAGLNQSKNQVQFVFYVCICLNQMNVTQLQFMHTTHIHWIQH